MVTRPPNSDCWANRNLFAIRLPKFHYRATRYLYGVAFINCEKYLVQKYCMCVQLCAIWIWNFLSIESYGKPAKRCMPMCSWYYIYAHLLMWACLQYHLYAHLLIQARSYCYTLTMCSCLVHLFMYKFLLQNFLPPFWCKGGPLGIEIRA